MNSRRFCEEETGSLDSVLKTNQRLNIIESVRYPGFLVLIYIIKQDIR